MSMKKMKGRRFYEQIQTKTCSTPTSFDSLNCIFNKEAHMLNIFYFLKTITFKYKKGCFKTWCTNWYTLKNVQI